MAQGSNARLDERSIAHETFTLERTYEASPAQVFHAWSDREAKARWFAGPPEWGRSEFELDFRIGGREIDRGGPKGGPVHSYEARYYDIVPNERIIFAYEMHTDEQRISVSLATVEIEPADTGTRLTFTEQGVYLEGLDSAAERKRGTEGLLDALGEVLRRGRAAA